MPLKALLIITFSLSSVSYATEFNWSFGTLKFLRNESQQTILKGDCSKISLYLQKIQKWRQKLGEKRSPFPSYDSVRINSGRSIECQVVIDDVLPDHLKNNLYKNAHTQSGGPNCWNGALFTSKILPNLRYTHWDEMTFYANSPICKKLTENQNPEMGDLVLNRSDGKIDEIVIGLNYGPTQERHGYIYLTDSLIIEKAGHQNYNSLNLNYPINSHITYKKYPWFFLDCRKPGKKKPAYCNYWADFYRCRTMDQYIGLYKKILSEDYLSLRDSLLKIETAISDAHFTPNVDLTEAKEYLQTLENNLKLNPIQITTTDNFEVENFLSEEIKIKIGALYNNIKNIEKDRL